MRADNKEIENLLKTARGQIDGILKMIEDNRYCIDISTQLLATSSIIKKANTKVIEAHIRGCISESFVDKNDKKLEEIIQLIEKISKTT